MGKALLSVGVYAAWKSEGRKPVCSSGVPRNWCGVHIPDASLNGKNSAHLGVLRMATVPEPDLRAELLRRRDRDQQARCAYLGSRDRGENPDWAPVGAIDAVRNIGVLVRLRSGCGRSPTRPRSTPGAARSVSRRWRTRLSLTRGPSTRRVGSPIYARHGRQGMAR